MKQWGFTLTWRDIGDTSKVIRASAWFSSTMQEHFSTYSWLQWYWSLRLRYWRKDKPQRLTFLAQTEASNTNKTETRGGSSLENTTVEDDLLWGLPEIWVSCLKEDETISQMITKLVYRESQLVRKPSYYLKYHKNICVQ